MKALLFTCSILSSLFSFGQPVTDFNQTATIAWMGKSAACVALCISGECDKTTNCDAYLNFHESAKKININESVYLKNNQFFLRQPFKKYLLGNTWDTKHIRLLLDADDRVIFYLISQPKIMQSQSSTASTNVHRIFSIPLGIKDLEQSGDVLLGTIPADMTDSFEVGIRYARYCKKQHCDPWSPNLQVSNFSLQMKAMDYPLMPALLDTLSVPSPENYSAIKTITCNLSFGDDRHNFSMQEVRALMDQLYEPVFRIQSISIDAAPSVLGDTTQSRKHIQFLADQLKLVISAMPEGKGVKSNLHLENGWNHFVEVIGKTALYFLTDSGIAGLKKDLTSNPLLIQRLKEFDGALHQAKVKLTVAFDTSLYSESLYWRTRMSKALKANKIDLALSFQKPLIRLCFKKKIPATALIPDQIKPTPYLMSLFNNQVALERVDSLKGMQYHLLLRIDPNNPLTKYNWLAYRMNLIRNQEEESYDDAMMQLMDAFNAVNSLSVHANLYALLHARFYYYEMHGRKDYRLLTSREMQGMIKLLSPEECLKLADQMTRLMRYDIAATIVTSAKEKITEKDTLLCKQYAMRQLYYSTFSGIVLSDKDWVETCSLLHHANPGQFKSYFTGRCLPYLLLTNPEIRKLYLDSP